MIALLGRGSLNDRWPPDRQAYRDGGPFAGFASNLEAASDQGHALAHTCQTERISLRHRGVRIETDAVVFYPQSQETIGGTQGNLYVGGRRMPRDIVVALL